MMLKSTRAKLFIIFGIIVFVLGFYFPEITCKSDSCPTTSASAGIIIVISFIIIAFGIPSYIVTKRSESRAQRFKDAEESSLRIGKQRDLLEQNIVLTKCPHCGGPLDIGDLTEIDTTNCEYCGSLLKFRSRDVIKGKLFRESDAEKLLLTISKVRLLGRGLLSRWNLFFTSKRIVVLKVQNSDYTTDFGRDLETGLDHLILADVRHNFDVMNFDLKSLKLREFVGPLGFQERAIEIEAGERNLSFRVNKQVFSEFKDKMGQSPIISSKFSKK